MSGPSPLRPAVACGQTGEALPIPNSAEQLLRLTQEPCVYYSEQTIHRELMNGLCAFMQVLERFYLTWASNDATVAQPPKHVFARQEVKGDWRVMPCAVTLAPDTAHGIGPIINAVKIIGTNEEQRVVPDKISVGKALLLHPTDHHVIAIFDVGALSSFRTAAISALAYKYWGRSSGDVVGIIGAGRIGYYTAAILNRWLGLESLLVHDRSTTRQEMFVAAVSPWFIDAPRAANLEAVCKDSHALFLATDSTTPIVDSRLAGRVRFISSVGADADNLSEIAADLVPHRTIVSESGQNIYFGDLKRWHDSGKLSPADIVPLTARMLAGDYRAQERPAVMFISTGTALQDALVCRFLHDRLGDTAGLRLGETTAPPLDG